MSPRGKRSQPVEHGLPVRELQLALLVDHAPEGDDWLHEQKFDGYRIVADRHGDRVTLMSRRFNDWTAQFPAVAAAVAGLPGKRCVLDGEVAVVAPDGRTSFQSLQNVSGSGGELTYFVFDLLETDAGVLTDLPLEQRKAKLHALLKRAPGILKYSDHVIGRGDEFFRAACKQGLEGIVSKRRDSKYSAGRGSTWVKTKCIQRQELVIGGWTDPEGSRTGIGAILVGYFADGKLSYAGKVGTGFTAATLGELRTAVDKLAIDKPAFDPPPQRAWTGPRVHWIKPTLVAEIAFMEWTTDGRLRHPSFKGLRKDKRATDVVRERAAHRE